MEPGARNRFGRVDLEVTAFGFGTAPVGNIFREIDERTSDAMFRPPGMPACGSSTPHRCTATV